jgi:ubiquinone biosynthesis UbiH/UbiF/VisC/COQ6 family hydroxylase
MNTNSDVRTDVLIVGAGPAGLCLAKALSGHDLKIMLVEQQNIDVLLDPPFDGREIALTQNSANLMRQLGIWEKISSRALSPLRDAHIYDGSSEKAMVIGHELSTFNELGWLVSNHLIRKAAYEAVLDAIELHQDITILASEKVVDIKTSHENAYVTLESGKRIYAQLIVAADSRFSSTRRAIGIPANMHDFGRNMLVCAMTHEKPHHHVAWEWFDYGQTLALLPMNPHSSTKEYQSSIVITLPDQEMAELMRLDDDAFARNVEVRFAHRLGKMSLVSTRHSYPLVTVYPERLVAERFATVGDAAVGMHPVTAHGFNFGLLSIDYLSKEVIEAKRQGVDIANQAFLNRFERRHRRATRPLYFLTRLITEIYTRQSSPLRLLRQAALRVGQALPLFRRAIAASLTGSHR